ncbi:MAG: helix-turn-helix transcriptional regulator [Solirubrobacterales bacterium]|nr:helix-turn-helix transcriptional regulator [Solirubrobacterales bacterium]
MFLSDGYSATTVQAIAAGAGVFADTIYKSFGGKPPGDPRSRARRGTLGPGRTAPTRSKERETDP